MKITDAIIVLAGPTAVGKTALSIKAAEHFGCEIISADSQQVYRGMDIGTAKIKKDEMQGIVHHMIDICEIDEGMDISCFSRRCREKIKEIHARKKNVLITGGSGLYIDSIVYQSYRFDTPGRDDALRETLYTLAAQHSKEYVYALLKEKDPAAALAIHPNNLQRVIRALEIASLTGEVPKNSKEGTLLPNTFYFVLDMAREHLYERIDQRVEMMFAQGLVEEVQGLLERGYDINANAFKAIGYKETIQYLSHKISLREAKEEIKKNSRHFAKRQLTWFRKNQDVHWIDVDKTGTEQAILQYMEKTICCRTQKN